MVGVRLVGGGLYSHIYFEIANMIELRENLFKNNFCTLYQTVKYGPPSVTNFLASADEQRKVC